MDDYFCKYEDRRPPEPIPFSAKTQLLWQFFAVCNLVLGAWYLHWRWTSSLNFDALWFSLLVAAAESLAYFGMILFTFNLWSNEDTPRKPAPGRLHECIAIPASQPDRPISVDVFFPTYDEDVELVRLSVLDAKKLRYPHDIDLKIYLLDDGRREAMAAMAKEEGVHYITRGDNKGFKAGNLRNAMERTGGDFIVICDADTRVFPSFLENTLGYFRDPQVAWVQTPQWFFDLPEGTRLPDLLHRYLGAPGRLIAQGLEKLVGPITTGEDPFANDPQLFYDVIQRRRNRHNASFCCGAGSIHRRDAVMHVALKAYVDGVEKRAKSLVEAVEDDDLREAVAGGLERLVAVETELTPYRFHVSEDLYTSIYLHSDPDGEWRSVFHPQVESKMLSPQDLQS
ncbi:MAG: cellulose synthase catalytic subunit, partial [Acidobacteriota bacterium]